MEQNRRKDDATQDDWSRPLTPLIAAIIKAVDLFDDLFDARTRTRILDKAPLGKTYSEREDVHPTFQAQENSQQERVRITKKEYGALMHKFIPDPGNWEYFGRKYLQVGRDQLSRVQMQYRGDDLKEEILKLWIAKHGDKATVSKAYELAYDFIKDEFEEVFRFLVRLIGDAKEWKSFAKHGLGLARCEYREHEDYITEHQKLQMLRLWRQKEGEDASVEKLCIALRTHFAGKSMLRNICEALMSPVVESQRAMSTGIEKVCKALEKVSINIHTSGTTAGNAFIGCFGTNIQN